MRKMIAAKRTTDMIPPSTANLPPHLRIKAIELRNGKAPAHRCVKFMSVPREAREADTLVLMHPFAIDRDVIACEGDGEYKRVEGCNEGKAVDACKLEIRL